MGLPALLLLAAAFFPQGGAASTDPSLRFSPATWKRLEAGEVVTRIVSAKGTEARRVRGVAIVPARTEAIHRVIVDYDEAEHIFPSTVESKLIRMESADRFLAYQMVEMPWPLKNVWFIIRVSRTRPAAGAIRLDWQLVRGNCKENTGFWLLESLGEGDLSLVTYELLFVPDGPLPAGLIRIGATRRMPEVIAALRWFSLRPRYARGGSR